MVSMEDEVVIWLYDSINKEIRRTIFRSFKTTQKLPLLNKNKKLFFCSNNYLSLKKH